VSSYRFCRTDDMPLLVAAYNRAFFPHQAEPEAPLDVAGLKSWIRDLDLWCSSCMIARDDAGELIGVLLGCKRPAETLVLAVGVHRDHLRRGHGRHLLTSLSSKLAILGPPRLVAEVPADDARACAFFESCGFVAEARLRDFVLAPERLSAPAAPALAQAVGVEELVGAGALAPHPPRPWARDTGALRRRSDVKGLALASPDRIEAWLLWREQGSRREILGLGSAPGADALLAPLLSRAAGPSTEPLRFGRVAEQEASWTALQALGFQPDRAHVRYGAAAGVR
jgi:ribosomal protein S18 acetylase RimI-like enzyme